MLNEPNNYFESLPQVRAPCLLHAPPSSQHNLHHASRVVRPLLCDSDAVGIKDPTNYLNSMLQARCTSSCPVPIPPMPSARFALHSVLHHAV